MEDIKIIDGEKFFKIHNIGSLIFGWVWFNNRKSRFSNEYKSIRLPIKTK